MWRRAKKSRYEREKAGFDLSLSLFSFFFVGEGECIQQLINTHIYIHSLTFCACACCSASDQVSRLVRIHSDDMEDINEAAAGQIVALFGVECSSGDTFTSGDRITMESMHTPAPVMSLAVAPKGTELDSQRFVERSRIGLSLPSLSLCIDICGESKVAG